MHENILAFSIIQRFENCDTNENVVPFTSFEVKTI